MKTALLEFVQAKEGLNIDEVSILGADSTAVNTGSKNGVIAKVEQKIKRPFHRFLCIFHLIELLLRHFVALYVGPTSGPTGFSSALGKAITMLSSPVITTFRRIPCPSFPTIPPEIIAVRNCVCFLQDDMLTEKLFNVQTTQRLEISCL